VLLGVQQALAQLNGCAQLVPCVQGNVDINRLLSMHAFRLSSDVLHARDGRVYNALDDMADVHTAATGSSTLVLQPAQVCSQDLLMAWLRQLLKQHWRQLYRIKGILMVRCEDSGCVRRFVVQGVHAELYGEFADGVAHAEAAATTAMPQQRLKMMCFSTLR
jgi:G3E family GTPase